MTYLEQYKATFLNETILGNVRRKRSRSIEARTLNRKVGYFNIENFRYQGTRESFKFNRHINNVVQMSIWAMNIFDSLDITKKTALESLTPEVTTLGRVNHARKQLEFITTEILNDRTGRWF